VPGHDDSITANAPPPFALVLVAAEVQVIGGGTVCNMRVALGTAYRPWRAWNAEAVLRGAPAIEELFRRAVLPRKAFKVPLARNTIVRTLLDLMEDDRP
jgi:xanthine dehydrogenase YagS FAD-binding subunit